jgi:ribose 5-phosphate isomerase B
MADPKKMFSIAPKHVGVSADHRGVELKGYLVLVRMLNEGGYEVADFGDHQQNMDDDYPDFVAPLAKAVARGAITPGLAIYGSGGGAQLRELGINIDKVK